MSGWPLPHDLYLRDDIAEWWRGQDPFDCADRLTGDVVREVARRRTLRCAHAGRGYFAKIHHGVGWAEIFKNWLTFKRPVLDARNEYAAATLLGRAGVPTLTVAAFGVRGRNPARRRSFLVTDEITPHASLEDYCLDWPAEPPPPVVKRVLIDKVAHVARTMHANGVNHRDFYICHLLLYEPDRVDSDTVADARLHLIDLHRAQKRSAVPRRWLVKDLGGLYYSAMDLGLSRRDLLRFLRSYFRAPLRDVLERHAGLLRAVTARARRLYLKAERRGILPRQQVHRLNGR